MRIELLRSCSFQRATADMPAKLGVALDEFCTIFASLDRDRNLLNDDEHFDMQEQYLTYGT
jgi:hypothetical protein